MRNIPDGSVTVELDAEHDVLTLILAKRVESLTEAQMEVYGC